MDAVFYSEAKCVLKCEYFVTRVIIFLQIFVGPHVYMEPGYLSRYSGRLQTDRQILKTIFSSSQRLDSLWGSPDRLCSLVIRGPGFHSRRYQILLRSSGSETGATQLCRDKWRASSMIKYKWSCSRSRKPRLIAVGTHYSDHATRIYPQKLALTSPSWRPLKPRMCLFCFGGSPKHSSSEHQGKFLWV
jgi:hypothetical protein